MNSRQTSDFDNRDPHPSESLEFATVPPHFTEFGHPHPSESLEFYTVPTNISGISPGIQPHPSELLDFATVHHSIDPLSVRSFSDVGDISSISSKPAATHFEFVKSSGSKNEEGRARRTAISEVGTGNVLRLADGMPGFTLADSTNATIAERRMTLREGLRLYPKAMAWSVMLSLTLVMEGYDLALITAFNTFPTFRKKFGHLTPDNGYQISTAWQSGLSNGASVGEILGLLINGIITERFGYRKCLISALLFLCAAIFLAFFSVHVSMLMASELLCGLSWGVFQTLSTTYAAEVMPVALRAYLTSNVNLCWLIGQVMSLSILRGTVGWANEWSYRLPFGLQWMFAIPILIGTWLAPDSPWWLVRHERFTDAKRALHRLTSHKTNREFNADETVALMRHTNEVEKCLTAGTSYWDCFKGTDLRRTEIVCMVWMIQTFSGGPMTTYSAYFFNRAGFSAARSFDLSAGMYGLAILAHLSALVLMTYVGRRNLYIFGCAASCATLFAAGIVACLPETTTTLNAIGALVILMTFWYDLTIGPVCYSLVAEIPSTRLRVKTVVLGRVSYNIACIVSNVIMPQMLNPEAWNLKGKTCFVWAVTAFLSLIWTYYRLPEPKGLTYMELDILFSKKAPTKKFKKFQVCLRETGYFELVEKSDEKHWEGVVT